MPRTLVITKEAEGPLPRPTIPTGTRPEVERWSDLGGGRRAIVRIRKLRPEAVGLHVPELELLKRPFAHKTFLLVAAPFKRKFICDDFGGHEDVSLFTFVYSDVPRLVAGLLVAPWVLARVWWKVGRLARPRTRKLLGADSARRVLVLRPHYFHTRFGGTLAHLHGVLDGLLAKGYEVDLVSTDRPAGLPDGVRHHHIPPVKALADLPQVQELATNFKLIRYVTNLGRGFDAVYQRHQGSSFFGLGISNQLKCPLILEFNSSDAARERLWGERASRLGALKLKVEVASIRNADTVVAVSEVLRTQALEIAGGDPSRIVVQSNGVNLNRFHPHLSDLRTRQVWGVPADAITVGFVGTMTAYMGLDVLMRAAELVCKVASSQHVHFVLIGEGGTKRTIEKMVSECDALAGRVHFTGAVDFQEVSCMVASLDIAVSPHNPPVEDRDFYWSPIKVFEYMASGLPTVASDVGQIATVIEDGHTGLLVPRGDVPALAAAIERLVTDHELRGRMGRRAREQAVAMHGWDGVVTRILEAAQGLAPLSHE